MENRNRSLIGKIIIFISGLIIAQAVLAATEVCDKYGTVGIRKKSNIYVVQNNVWNDYDGSQCVEVKANSGDFIVSKSTHNLPTNGAPASYASIYKGCHWGTCTNKFNSGMPMQLKNILRANSSWSTKTDSVTGVFNASYDMWLNKTPVTCGQPDGAEIMVWLNKEGNIQPNGSIINKNKAIRIDGAMWTIWKGEDDGIPVISYVRKNPTNKASNLNLKSFLFDAENRGYIDFDLYLVAVEAGFEIWQGGEGLTSKAFNVLVE